MQLWEFFYIGVWILLYVFIGYKLGRILTRRTMAKEYAKLRNELGDTYETGVRHGIKLEQQYPSCPECGATMYGHPVEALHARLKEIGERMMTEPDNGEVESIVKGSTEDKPMH